ncbi:MAG: hypothetical protein A3A43_00370 [Candidatus Liptonbacteria bacterium RIFCSPLOWO2_01_FULL_56_20]|uniref:GIY-YIG domain-containing protein n=1 Tax=Candidatus Liptonbacteria bacterium RIFCSPLOWO2_01_FULL_56_20 TaxID=1798652 RepID=A0A1G2CIA8_9BACT|nr:MAG: hypothetical protein A2681_02755 [Candidatus Liptonbacteria bacterium RIFCSPHIGHO2_01_FULL_56_18b]OGZ01126.1 MAG: hypothetical protein A3A43_00370 [Candidatus Liptonbacteria bacterium RIFCSPLOWO2_01_FULL_56_20]
MFFVYILRSLGNGKFYIGSTKNLAGRIERHNRGSNVYTRKFRPFELVWNEKYNTRAEAIRRELQIKGWKSKALIEKLIENS